MSEKYQALYRVWRPKTFDDMVGQEAIRRTLCNQVRTRHIAHAYLFCGSRGTGKTSAAKIMAKAVNCEHPVNGNPCGECQTCQLIESGMSMDILEMDAASNSQVEQTREMLEGVDYPPQFGQYKVYIIDEVHMLSKSAFNALLKTIEEPPSYMVFILATTEPNKVPPTIISRCQRFDFGRFSEAELIERMKTVMKEKEIGVTDEAYALIAQSAEGGMRDALSLLDMCLGAGEKVTEESVRMVLGAAGSGFLFEYAEQIAKSDSAGAMQKIAELMRSGRDVQVFLKDIGRHFRLLLTAKLCGAAPEVLGVGADAAARYARQAELFSADRLLRVTDLMMHAEADTRAMSSARAVLEVCTLRACQNPEGQDVAALLERIAELENKMSRLEAGAVSLPAEQPAKKMQKQPAKKPEQAPPDGPVQANGKTPKDIWNAALSAIKKNDSGLFSFIALGEYGGFRDGVYRQCFDQQNSFIIGSLNERKDKIEAALRDAGASDPQYEAILKPEKVDADGEKIRDESQNQLTDTFGRDTVILHND